MKTEIKSLAKFSISDWEDRGRLMRILAESGYWVKAVEDNKEVDDGLKYKILCECDE